MPIDARDASKSVLIEVLQVLGAFRDDLVIVGGSVPELLLPGRQHIGTQDVDLAVAPSAFAGNAYETICRRLVDAGYSLQTEPTTFLRVITGLDLPIKVDLISGQYPSDTSHKLAAIQVNELTLSTLRGLDPAFRNCRDIEVSGLMPDGSSNSVRARIVEPEAFILIKAFALNERQKQKDAYDIAFVLRNHEPDLQSLAARLMPLVKSGLAHEAYQILKSKFASLETIGPRWAANVYASGAGEDFAQAQRAAYESAKELFRLTDQSSI